MEEAPKLGITANGKQYQVDVTDFDGLEARAFRKEVGVAIMQALKGISDGSVDPLELVAGFKWLYDRRENEDLEFEDVLKGLSYDTIDFDMDDDVEEPENPPVDGGSSAPSYPPSPPPLASIPGR